MTLGEKRVKVDFNVSNDTLVDQIKVKTAELIDLLESMNEQEKTVECTRLIDIAQTNYETACMYAVKANFTK